ncbi:MAG: serine protease [Crocinitomicaceae bacterium]|nr:serine protease [Crocinitomicaceae bacterium]|tara:strand:+ start:4847 stop:7009 length:2163 start_codon:yes stop_codon:yes gene_type:complete
MKKVFIVIQLFIFSISLSAKEGMWIPSLIKNLVESDMQNMGMKLTAEDIYSFNKSSLKDAIVHFGGGCTAEMISDQGLLLTNHHCGYSRIQAHSSVENDYLTDGFWAMNRSEEKKNPGLTATFIIKIEDVTEQILEGVEDGMPEADRQKIIAENIKKVGEKAIAETHYKYIIRPFYYGNEYFMFLTETFKDVRLVGAPPSSVGKFGFDTDNWIWPRHTGDFSIFRIYASKDNKPADVSDDNVPFKPRHSLPVSMSGVQQDDFTMVYGFPGRTSEYLTSHSVRYTMEKLNPNRIKMRDIALEILAESMASSDKIRIQYAAKQSRVSNAWKKWIGQNKGLYRNNAIEKKLDVEKRFMARAEETTAEHGLKYKRLLKEYERVYKEIEPYDFGRAMFIELYYNGPEIVRFALAFEQLNPEKLKEDADIEQIKNKLRKSAKGFFKNYDLPTDQKLMVAMLDAYFQRIDSSLRQDIYSTIETKYKMNYEEYASYVFGKTTFSTEDDVNAFLDKYKDDKSFAKIQKDPAYILATSLMKGYREKVSPEQKRLSDELAILNRTYMEGLMVLLPNEQKYYPDANSTLRVSYGKVEGYDAADAVTYKSFTTTKGILEKRDTTMEFTVPDKLVQLIETNDYGPYVDKDGSMHVCFVASNHTTGGNSGSPALNGKGELVGLNFDRTWESTMSDIMFDPTICRNIMVDIRYVLFIVDKYAGAGHLIEEMNLVNN